MSKSTQLTTPKKCTCLAPNLCGRREVEIGSNRVYISGCAREGSPRLYQGFATPEETEEEAT